MLYKFSFFIRFKFSSNLNFSCKIMTTVFIDVYCWIIMNIKYWIFISAWTMDSQLDYERMITQDYRKNVWYVYSIVVLNFFLMSWILLDYNMSCLEIFQPQYDDDTEEINKTKIVK